MNIVVKNITVNETIVLSDFGITLVSEAERDLLELCPLQTIQASHSLKDYVIDEKLSINGITSYDGLSQLLPDSVPSFNGYLITWSEFKTFINQKEDAMVYIDRSDVYFITSIGYPFYCYISKNTSEADDFEDNYKTFCDKIKASRSDGRLRVHSTTCREDHHPQFISGGNGMYNGNRIREVVDPVLLYEMPTTADYEIVRDLIFVDEIHIKDGYIFYENAPWGAKMNVEIVHPSIYPPGHPYEFLNNTVIRCFIPEMPIYGDCLSGRVLPTDAPGAIAAGMIVRIRIKNPSTPAPQAWKAWGMLKIHQKYTTSLEAQLGDLLP